MKADFRNIHVLLIVQNLSVPFDRRVWREANALKSFGYEVSVICPMGPGYDTENRVVLNDIHIYRYKLKSDSPGFIPFILEYAASFFKTIWIAARIFARKPFQVIHTANPPDIFFALAFPFRLLFGVKFIYDQHDLCPELFLQKFGKRHRMIMKVQYLLERFSYRSSSAVIATNESLKEIAVRRGRVNGNSVFVVRNGPDQDFASNAGEFSGRGDFKFICSYVGVMGAQDGVDYIVRAADIIVHSKGRSDICFVLVGGGEKLHELKELARALEVSQYVQFTGRIPDADLKAVLKASDVCLAPDPENDFNTWHTMNKIMDYMLFGKPIVSFDLKESRVSAGEAAVYVKENDPGKYASAILSLLSEPERRAQMGRVGIERVRDLTWEHSVLELEKAYRFLFRRKT